MTDKKKMLARCKALIARTTSDSEEEARTSALLACKLMREHGFEVVDPGNVTKPARTSPRNPYAGFEDDFDMESFLRDMGRAAGMPPNWKPPHDDFTSQYRERVNEERRRQAAENIRQQEAARKQQEEKNKKDLAEKRKKKRYENRPCPTKQPSGPMYQKKDIKWQAFPADVGGGCTGCNRPFKKGDSVVWASGFGAFRSQCMESKKDDFLFVALQPDLVEDGTEETEPDQFEDVPMFCKARVWTKLYTSGFDGRCKQCGLRYFKGDPIRWIRGVGSYHTECWNGMDEYEELPVGELIKAIDAVRKEYRDSDWQELKDDLY